MVQKPISRLQKDDPRQFQIGQLERRFSTTEKVADGGSTLSFQLVPSDPDFPFELTGLDCVLRVPDGYPESSRPSLAVSNYDMPRGYQINVEKGFDALAQALPNATLLSYVNALDKQLEALLTGPKAETIKIVSNASKLRAQQPHDSPNPTKEAPKASRSIVPSVKEAPVSDCKSYFAPTPLKSGTVLASWRVKILCNASWLLGYPAQPAMRHTGQFRLLPREFCCKNTNSKL